MTSAREIVQARACGKLGCPCADSARHGKGLTHCPAHSDVSHLSLNVTPNAEKGVLLYCHAGCSQSAVIRALQGEGLWADSDSAPLPVTDSWTPRGAAIATYPYPDEQGRLLFTVCKTADKQFPTWRPDPSKPRGKTWSLDGVRRVPFRLPQLLRAVQDGRTIYVCEGEKDALAVVTAGAEATCNPHGAGKWRDEYDQYFAGAAEVVIIRDRDEVGAAHARQVYWGLKKVAGSVRVVQALEGKDAADHLGTGHGLDDFVEVDPEDCQGLRLSGAKLHPSAPASAGVSSHISLFSHPETIDEWPAPPDEAAYYGLAGEIVAAIRPYSEADPVALLANLLAGYGNAVGREPYVMVGATRHYARDYFLLAGRTAKARKGDSWPPILTVLQQSALGWGPRILSGLASGEGLIHVVRDRVEKEEAIKGRPGEYQTVVVDEGVKDKRIVVMEPELARVIRVQARQGSTLSPILRDAWDTGNLAVMTRNSPLQATGAHISLIGHITIEELRRELPDIELANGWANRFNIIAVRRSQEIPEPEPFTGEVVASLASDLGDALEQAGLVRRMERDAEASEFWRERYHSLTAEREGLAGSLLARLEAHVLRLSMVYALLDGTGTIRLPHLNAALAFAEYTERSVLHIFGNATGDPVADTIERALRQNGDIDRTAISALFGRHESAARIDKALQLLLTSGRAHTAMASNENGGRPREVWSPV